MALVLLTAKMKEQATIVAPIPSVPSPAPDPESGRMNDAKPNAVRRRWSSGLFDICADTTSSLSVCFCYPITTTQLWLRYAYTGTKAQLMFALLVCIFWGNQVLNGVNNILFAPSMVLCEESAIGADHLVFPRAGWNGGRQVEAGDPCFTLAPVPMWLSQPDWLAFHVLALVSITVMITAVVLTCSARRRQRAAHQIPALYCHDACEDVCLSYWCFACTQCQMMRHAGMTSDAFQLFDAEGGAQRGSRMI